MNLSSAMINIFFNLLYIATWPLSEWAVNLAKSINLKNYFENASAA